MRFQKWLTEATNDDFVVVYAGRFQPFHKGHFETYQRAVREFGKERVYIGTSDKVQLPKSPFNFKEKHRIITKLFDVPKDKVVQIKNPYKPVEVLNKFPDDTAYIAVVGQKDANRLVSGKYFEMYGEVGDMKGYQEEGYIWVAPPNTTKHNGKQVSGTLVREIFGSAPDEEKKDLFLSLYPKFDEEIFELITSKIQ